MRHAIINISFFFLLIFLQVFGNSRANANNRQIEVKHFNKPEYQAANQNWSVASAGTNFVYFANHKGLLQFDGSSWELHELPQQNITRSVKVISDSLIFTSGYRELGYWKRDEHGQLNYTSLKEKAQKYISSNVEFWNIEEANGSVYFHAFTDILKYHGDSIISIPRPGFCNSLNKAHNKVFCSIRDLGIYEIKNDSLVPYCISDFLIGKLIRFILPYKNDALLLGTSSHGIFICDQNSVSPWNNDSQDYFAQNDLNRGFVDPNGNFIFGSIVDGLIMFDKNGNLLKKLNKSSGLQNNTVLGIHVDDFNNIWLALDNGIDFISNNVDQSFIVEPIPEIGAIYSAAIFNNQLYLGTNQGLYKKPWQTNNKFEMVPGTEGQIWDCSIMDNNLIVGQNEGTYIIQPGKMNYIGGLSGGFSVRKDELSPGHLLQCTYSSLIKYKKQDNTYIYQRHIGNFTELIRYFEIDYKGTVWASHMHRGILKLKLDESRNRVISNEYFGENSVFEKDNNIHVFKVENRIVFTTGEKLFTYDDLQDSIVPYKALNSQLGSFVKAHRIIAAPNHHYWFIAPQHIGLFKITDNSVALKKEYPSVLLRKYQLVDGFENILPISEEKAILCLGNGIAHLDASFKDSANIIEDYKPTLRDFQLFNNKGEPAEKKVMQNKKMIIAYNNHNILLRFAFPHYTHEELNYRLKLKGKGDFPEIVSSNPEFRYDRLPSGEYEMKVTVNNQWGNTSQPLLLKFKVLPPIYESNLAKISYIIVILFSLYLFRASIIRKAKKREQEKHEKKERELIKLRNDKLRSEVKYKSKELANSTMSIIKKNEFLLELKSTLQKQKEELGTRYPDKYFNHITDKIDRNITSNDDWEIFELNFERAHEQFLKKLKDKYPKLTPKDLRLCAYLKMNLSSKEIAPLLGVSHRGVENHRYKLRKKFELEHDDNLVEFIFNL